MVDRDSSVDVTSLFARALFRHRYRCAFFFALSILAALLITALTPKSYQTEAKLFLRLGRENVALDPTATLGESGSIQVPISREQEVKTVVELLHDRILMERVVDKLTPPVILNPPSGTESSEPSPLVTMLQNAVGNAKSTLQGWLIAARLKTRTTERQKAMVAVEKNLEIKAVRDTNVVNVTYESPSPALSQSVVCVLLDGYLEHHAQLNRTVGSNELLTERVRIAKERLTEIEQQIADLKSELDLSSPEDERRVVVEQIGRLEGELALTLGEISGSKTKLRELDESLQRLPETVVASEVNGIADAGTDGMRQQYYALQLREQELAAKFTDVHPALVDVRRQREAAAMILKEEETSREQVTRAASPSHQQVSLALLNETPIQKAAEAKAETLRASLADARGHLSDIARAESQLAKLEREQELRNTEYRQSVANYEKSQMDEAMERQGISNVAIAQEPTLAFDPVSPHLGVNLILGVLIGALGAVGLAFLSERLDHSLRTPEELEENLQLPTLAVIPRMKSSQLGFLGRN